MVAIDIILAIYPQPHLGKRLINPTGQRSIQVSAIQMLREQGFEIVISFGIGQLGKVYFRYEAGSRLLALAVKVDPTVKTKSHLV